MSSTEVNNHRGLERICGFLRRSLFSVLQVGPIPRHIAFILDGNRRFARKRNIHEGAPHRIGFVTMLSILKYCAELGVECVSMFVFSIDNFSRNPELVKFLMELMQEKLEGLVKQESVVNKYGVRVQIVGDLNLLEEPVRVAAENAVEATAHNNKMLLLLCAAYNSTNEITHAVQKACLEKWNRSTGQTSLLSTSSKDGDKEEEPQPEQSHPMMDLADIERHMHMPEVDMIIRTSGETRLSNFALWQTTGAFLYSPTALWPEFGLRHLVWAILNYQRHFRYLQQKINLSYIVN